MKSLDSQMASVGCAGRKTKQSAQRKSFRRNRWASYSVAASLLGANFIGLMGSSAYAQGADEDNAIDVITVTARGREESIQDVPLAITAFDKEALEQRSIVELEDIARFTSGFSFEDFSGGFSNPVIRGQSQTRATALESNVSAFFDGIYVPRSWAVDIGASNLERIEVVKGPQSARYGRNAFSGAINYVPVKASLAIEDSITGEVSATAGSDERFDGGFTLQGKVNEQFALAASYNYSTFDGSYENTHPFADLDLGKGTSGNIGGWDNSSFSLSALYEPTDRLSFEVAYYNYSLENEARASQWFGEAVSPGIFNCGSTRFGQGSLICGELPEATDTAIADPRDFGVHSDTDLLRFSASFDITDALSVNYLYGVIQGDVDIGTSGEPDRINCGTVVGPPAFANLCNFQNAPVGDIDYSTHEVRLSFDNGGAFRFAGGLFVSDGQDEFRFNSLNLAPITDPNNFQPLVGTPIPSFNFNPGPFNIELTNESTDTDVMSVFGETQWTSKDGLTRAGVELRYSETNVTTVDNRRDLGFTEDFKAFTPRVIIERDFTEQTMVYGSISRGAKTGGFNATAIAPENQTFDEEFNWTYEIGTKNVFMDDRLVLNGAFYYTDWQDIQINSSDPDAANPNAVNITLNLGNAEIVGFELDAIFYATDNLTFDGTFSLASGEYTDGTVDGRLFREGPGGIPAPCDDVVCNSNGLVEGNEIERTPQTQASIGAQWDNRIDAWDADYYVRTDISWQSSFFATTANVGEIPSRTLTNLRAGVTFANNFDVSVWARNLTDEQFVSNAFVVLLPFGNTYGNFFGERRTFGVTGRYRF